MPTIEKGERRVWYTADSFTTSNENDDPHWFRLEIKFHHRRFRLSVSSSNFHNSPTRFEEFQKYHKFLVLENVGPNRSVEKSDQEKESDQEEEESDREEESDKEEEESDQGENEGDGIALNDCFNWAVMPFLDEFDRLAPGQEPLKEGEQLNLSHFLAVDTLECSLTAVDDVLIPGRVKLADDPADDDYWPFPYPSPYPTRNDWTTTFPSFQPEEVLVVCDDEDHPFDSRYTQVYIGEEDLFFKEGIDLDDEATKTEIDAYKEINHATSGFGPPVHTSRLYGVVRNKKSQIVGLLLYYIDEAYTLKEAIQYRDPPQASRDKWARQIAGTMVSLHLAGVVWGDAKPDNILIDKNDDAWIIDFGGGYTAPWVDAEDAGTMEGDELAVERILRFMTR